MEVPVKPSKRAAPWFPLPPSEARPWGGTVSRLPRGGRPDETRHEHLDALCSPDCAQQHAEGLLAESQPHPDPAIERWRRANLAFTRLVLTWSEVTLSDAVTARWFSVPPGRMRFPTEVLHLAEWSVLSYREERGAPTAVERHLASGRLRDPDAEAVARAATEALPTLFHVAAVERGAAVTLRPLLPDGPAVVCPDRGASHTLAVGSVLAARILRLGGHALLRPVGVAVPPGRAERVLPRLLEAFERYVRTTGRDDLAAFLGDQSEHLFHATADALG